MRSLTHDYPHRLLEPRDPPCLSIYQPTHRHAPESGQDPIRFKNLIRTLEESLEDFDKGEVEGLLRPFRDLEADAEFWRHNCEGLAVLANRDEFLVYRLQRPVPEVAIVADTFHTKPLLRIMQSADRFQVLGLDRENVRLFEGTRDSLDEVELADDVPKTITDALGDELTEPHLTMRATAVGRSGGRTMVHGHGARADEIDTDTDRFFRFIDKAILEYHSKPSKLPLLLATLPEYQGVFRELSNNPYLVEGRIDVHPKGVDLDELLEHAWEALEPSYLTRLAELVERFGTAAAHEKGSADISDVAVAAVGGRVDTVLIESERVESGRVDPETGRVEFGDIEDSDAGDVLDEVGEHVLRNGGEVVIVPAERMPTETGLAAIYRY
ncbi:MAG: hypothetical protein H0U69_15710 [Trueperaceae bacterium]|nr:hypothetical protein [Trueperaceae bacterium]